MFQLYLSKMLQAIGSYFYPANDSAASDGLHSFIAILCTYFVNRVHLERHNTKWKSKTPGSYKNELGLGRANAGAQNSGLSF
jgi:hypothetical protein